MIMPIGETLLTSIVSGPSDTASLTYGNGFDICGPLSYSLVDSLDNVVNLSWLEFYYDIETDLSDTLYINLISEPEGTIHKTSLQVKAELDNYPMSTPAYITFNVRYRGCFYDAFTASPIRE